MAGGIESAPIPSRAMSGQGSPHACRAPERPRIIPGWPISQHDHGVAVQASKPELARPPLYSVMILNDNYTPMDFVVEVP